MPLGEAVGLTIGLLVLCAGGALAFDFLFPQDDRPIERVLGVALAIAAAIFAGALLWG